MHIEQLLHPDALAVVLSAPHACWPGGFLRDAAPLRVPSASRRPEASTTDGAPSRAAPGAGLRLRVLSVRREPLAGGVSGAHLERVLVEVEIGPGGQPHREIVPLIFKRLKPDESWLMRASGDTRCREVQLWRHGLLADAPPALCVPVLAVAYDEETRAGALLLADVGRWLGRLVDCYAPVAPQQQARYLDHLARLHAHYWEDARLRDARFALASVEQALLMLAPATIEAQLAAGDTHSYLPISRVGWEAFFTYGPPDALARVQRVFAAPAALLASAAEAPVTLLHGDTWPANMGMLPGERGIHGRHAGSRTILIDWALATAGPASFDPFWLLFAWKQVDTRLALLAYRQRLTRHLARRGISLKVAEWRLLVDLGIARTVMTCGETMGQDVLFARSEPQRARAIAALGRWTRWAANVIERRGWD